MTRNHSKEALRKVMKPVGRPEAPMPGQAYRQIGVRLWGEGAYERETIDGAETRYKSLSRVEENDIIVNKIWARHGSVAVVTAGLAGCYASNEFPTYVPTDGKLEPRWFHWFTKTRHFWEQCDEKSRGTSGQNRIRPERFLEILIPLPPIADQRRIIARIEKLSAKIEEARGLRKQSITQVNGLWRSALRTTFTNSHSKRATIDQVCSDVIDNLHSTPSYNGDDFPCIRSQDIGWGTIDYSQALRTSDAEFQHRIRRGEPRKGDIVFVREGDVGRCAVVDGSRRFSLGQRVMMFRPKEGITDSYFMMYQLMSPPILDDQVVTAKTGTTSHHVNIKHLKHVIVAHPPLGEQRQIVAYLDDLQAKVADLRKLQEETAKELDALMPSILSKAFSGSL